MALSPNSNGNNNTHNNRNHCKNNTKDSRWVRIESEATQYVARYAPPATAICFSVWMGTAYACAVKAVRKSTVRLLDFKVEIAIGDYGP